MQKQRPSLPFVLPRTWLFVPGDRPDRVAKALALPTDAVIVDLEDAVAESRKVRARETVHRALSGQHRANVFVRVNGASTEWFDDDIAALDGLRLAGIVLPMAASAEDIRAADDRLGEVAAGRWIVPIIETAAGLRAVFEIAQSSPSVLALAFGGGDFSLDMGFPWPEGDQLPFLIPRVTVALAARSANLGGAIDTPNGNIHDLEGLAAEAANAVSLGFRGKFAIHPKQLEIIDNTFRPATADLERARRISDAFSASETDGNAAVMVGEIFVDYPIAMRARALIARAEASTDVGRGPSQLKSAGNTKLARN
jgi:citrate lyase beta subunit